MGCDIKGHLPDFDLFFCNSRHVSFIRLRDLSLFTASFTHRFCNIHPEHIWAKLFKALLA